MKITKEWLKKQGACSDGFAWWSAQNETDGGKVVEKLITEKKLEWANWLIVRFLETHEDKIRYAVFASEQVLDIFEKEYPGDDRPRKAIEAAQVVIADNTGTTREAAGAAGDAARAAGDAMKTKIIRYGISLMEAK